MMTMMTSSLSLLLLLVVGLTLGASPGKNGTLEEVVKPSVTQHGEDQMLTPVPAIPVVPAIPAKESHHTGELHLGRSRVGIIRKHHARAFAIPVNSSVAHSHTATVVCGNTKCDHHEICIYHRKAAKHICVRAKAFKSRRHGRGHGGKVLKASSKLDKDYNMTQVDAHKKLHRLQLRARDFEEQHGRKFKLPMTTDRIMKLRSKKFVEDNSVENNTSDKSSKECRQRELDGIGRRLLDQFKMNQDEDLDRQKTTNKRRKEKRNSTKKELHEDDECICQAPVIWQFQNLDADADGHLSRTELQSLTTQSACISQFIGSCNHDNDPSLSEKEWCCCFADILPPCLASLKTVPSILVRGQPVVLAGAFVPQCDDDGFFSKVQCHASTGQCWCVDQNGQKISSTATPGTPDCAKSDLKAETKPTPTAKRETTSHLPTLD